VRGREDCSAVQCAVLYCDVEFLAVQCAVLYCDAEFSAVQCAVLYCDVEFLAVQCAVLYCEAEFSAVQCARYCDAEFPAVQCAVRYCDSTEGVSGTQSPILGISEQASSSACGVVLPAARWCFQVQRSLSWGPLATCKLLMLIHTCPHICAFILHVCPSHQPPPPAWTLWWSPGAAGGVGGGGLRPFDFFHHGVPNLITAPPGRIVAPAG
jgi:hypothetical protein